MTKYYRSIPRIGGGDVIVRTDENGLAVISAGDCYEWEQSSYFHPDLEHDFQIVLESEALMIITKWKTAAGY